MMSNEIEIYNHFNLAKEKYNICPNCSHLRSPKNQKIKCLLTDWETGIATCQHCKKVLQIHRYKGFKNGLDFYFPKTKKAEIKGSFHSEDFFNELKSNCIVEKNNLSRYLEKYFSIEDIINAEKKLMIFSTNDFYQNSICYPYIDEDGKVTGIKVMAYKENGCRRRNKNDIGLVNWMHSIHKIENWVNDFCLFGLHQVTQRPEKVVHIVESEKTAFIMSIVKPEFIWLASGGLNMLNKRKLKPLIDYKIVLHPDKGNAYNHWKQFADELKTFNIITSRITEDNPCITDKGDLADYYLK